MDNILEISNNLKQLSSDTEIYYEYLPEADYYYSMTLYDVYGNCYYTDMVTFTVDENGDIWYDEDELNG